MLEALREQLYELHLELPKNNLVGQPDEIALEDIAKLHHRYTRQYGQR